MLKYFLTVFLLTVSSTSFAADSLNPNAKIYLMGLEEWNQNEYKTSPSAVERYPVGVALKNSSRPTNKVVTKTTAEENKTSFNETLKSFQEAIKGLCIEEMELNLAFSVKANAWVVVSGEVAAGAKVILKNPKKECN